MLIKSKPFWFDTATGTSYRQKPKDPTVLERCTYWDSVLEFRIYAKLLVCFPPGQIIRQHKITLFPASPPFKEWSWKVDFVIVDWIDPTKHIAYVEAKGDYLLADKAMASSFMKTLRILKEFQPNVFNKLYIVGNKQWTLPLTSITTLPANALIPELKRRLVR